jgi:hypothetical protein
MRTRTAWLVATLVLSAGGFAALTWTRGQERSPSLTLELSPAHKEADPPDLSKYNSLQKQIYLSAQRGADWLQRANKSDGRFVYGYLPALKTNLEGDHYLRQAGAAFALARAARFTGNERYKAVARQAVLTLLLDTAPDDQDSRIRHTTLPSTVVNRLAAAGLLVLAINELPSPGDDLLKQSEELCAFIARQQRPDGSLNYSDTATAPSPQAKSQTDGGMEDPDGINYYPGEALYGLMRSQQHRPADWKIEVVRKARPFYVNWWRKHQNMALVPWHTAAYTEAFLLTKEVAFADTVNEMTDWIWQLQYVRLDPRHPFWVGGFMTWVDGKPAMTAPQVSSASYAEGLAEACRVARELSDVTRHKRYREALERCLQFLTTLQYIDANTQHFADWYRPALLGGFYTSHQDGTLRIDYTQHAVCAMVQYLNYVRD